MRLRLPRTAPLALALAISAPAGALAPLAAQAAQPGAGAAIDIPFTRYVLPNGLTLIVHEDHKAPIVAVNVWYHVGSKNERPGRTGFAHLFEHLMFNGSENYNQDYFGPLQQVGATDLNGTTNEDRTNYFQNVPVNALDLVLLLESDRMGHLLGAITQARARRAARRGPEREAAERERALRAGVGVPQSPALPAEPPLLLERDRLDGGSRRRQAGGREGVVPDLLRRRQRGGRGGGRREGRRREGPGGEVLRRHPRGSADRAPGGVGRQAEREPARRDVRPGAAGAGLQGLERAGVGHRGRRRPRSCSATCSAAASPRDSTSGWCTTSRSRPA